MSRVGVAHIAVPFNHRAVAVHGQYIQARARRYLGVAAGKIRLFKDEGFGAGGRRLGDAGDRLHVGHLRVARLALVADLRHIARIALHRHDHLVRERADCSAERLIRINEHVLFLHQRRKAPLCRREAWQRSKQQRDCQYQRDQTWFFKRMFHFILPCMYIFTHLVINL